jgi:vacuolar-type H+-ATPase subunit I/STV1
VRDRKAHDLWTKYQSQVSDVPLLDKNKIDIQKAAERHERYLAIEAQAMHKASEPMSTELIKSSVRIELDKDKIHIAHLAAISNKKSDELIKQIEKAQKSNKELILVQLKKDYPVLTEYDKLLNERGKVSGFRAEQMDKLLLIKAREITKDKKLSAQIQRNLPKLTQSLALRIKNHDLGLEKER